MLKINTIELKNFRCYEHLKVEFNPKYNVFVGINSAGKTTILDAVAIALGAYISGFDAIGTLSIAKEDARVEKFSLGSTTQIQAQFPVKIIGCGETGQKNIRWERAKNSINGSTTRVDASQIINHAKDIQNKVRKGEVELILPVIVYYGTGRLWLQKKEKKQRKMVKKNTSRLDGYIDCLSSASNTKLMIRWFEKMTYISLQENKEIPELEAVKEAIEKTYLMVDETAVKITITFQVKKEELEIEIIRKTGEIEQLPLKQLSDGTKSILSLVADIAYRMAVLNPQLSDGITRKTPGIVMIDEIDMHLHPSWQSKIVGALHEVFPKVQFMFTTHAPTVLANIDNRYIQEVTRTEVTKVNEKTFGRSVGDIIEDIMGAPSRNVEIKKRFKEFYDAIDSGKLGEAKEILQELEEQLGETEVEVVKAQTTLFLEEVLDDRD